MNRLASKLAVPVASTLLAGLAALAACLPEESEPEYPIVPISGPPVSSGTMGSGGGNDNGGGGDGGGGGFGDAGVGVGDASDDDLFGDGGLGFPNDAPAALLDAAPADAGTTLIPSDAQGAPPFPEGDQIP
jgi:hypothetical protein